MRASPGALLPALWPGGHPVRPGAGPADGRAPRPALLRASLLRAALLGLAVTVPCCLLLVPRLGIVGAALGMSAAYAASATYLFSHYRRALAATWADLLPGWPDLRWLMLRLVGKGN